MLQVEKCISKCLDSGFLRFKMAQFEMSIPKCFNLKNVKTSFRVGKSSSVLVNHLRLYSILVVSSCFKLISSEID